MDAGPFTVVMAPEFGGATSPGVAFAANGDLHAVHGDHSEPNLVHHTWRDASGLHHELVEGLGQWTSRHAAAFDSRGRLHALWVRDNSSVSRPHEVRHATLENGLWSVESVGPALVNSVDTYTDAPLSFLLEGDEPSLLFIAKLPDPNTLCELGIARKSGTTWQASEVVTRTLTGTDPCPGAPGWLFRDASGSRTVLFKLGGASWEVATEGSSGFTTATTPFSSLTELSYGRSPAPLFGAAGSIDLLVPDSSGFSDAKVQHRSGGSWSEDQGYGRPGYPRAMRRDGRGELELLGVENGYQPQNLPDGGALVRWQVVRHTRDATSRDWSLAEQLFVDPAIPIPWRSRYQLPGVGGLDPQGIPFLLQPREGSGATGFEVIDWATGAARVTPLEFKETLREVADQLLDGRGRTHVAYVRQSAETGQFETHVKLYTARSSTEGPALPGAKALRLALGSDGIERLVLLTDAGKVLLLTEQAAGGYATEEVIRYAPATRLTLALDATDQPHVAWVEPNGSSSSDFTVRYAWRDDLGWNVESAARYADDEELSLFVDGQGAVRLGYGGFGNGVTVVLRGSASWSELGSTTESAGEQAALDRNGRPCWLTWDGATTARTACIGGTGQLTQTAQVTFADIRYGTPLGLARDGNGRLAGLFTKYGSSSATGVLVTEPVAGGSWSARSVALPDFARDLGVTKRLAFTSGGRLQLLGYDSRARRLLLHTF